MVVAWRLQGGEREMAGTRLFGKGPYGALQLVLHLVFGWRGYVTRAIPLRLNFKFKLILATSPALSAWLDTTTRACRAIRMAGHDDACMPRYPPGWTRRRVHEQGTTRAAGN